MHYGDLEKGTTNGWCAQHTLWVIMVSPAGVSSTEHGCYGIRKGEGMPLSLPWVCGRLSRWTSPSQTCVLPEEGVGNSESKFEFETELVILINGSLS